MRSRRVLVAVMALAAVGLLLGGVAFGQDRMPKLPQAYTFPQTGDSPGKVTFNHVSHVDDKVPSCTACHPTLFKILKAGQTPDGRKITHDGITKGQACGACHNGKKSFGFDDCTLCHRSQ